MMRPTSPAARENAVTPPPAPRGSTALFARFRPARKLIVVVGGWGEPEAVKAMSPLTRGTTVTLTATASAAVETPQRPAAPKPRDSWAARFGPPAGPATP